MLLSLSKTQKKKKESRRYFQNFRKKKNKIMGLKNDLCVFMDSVAEGCDDILSNVLSEE